MNQTTLENVAKHLATHILTEVTINYNNSPTGELINTEEWLCSDFDEYIHDVIKEWDYLNNDVLSDMKTGAFETDGTDTVRDMIYQIIKNYCEFERDAASVSNKNDGKMNFKHFSTVLEQTKQKGGTLYQKLSSVIEDFV